MIWDLQYCPYIATVLKPLYSSSFIKSQYLCHMLHIQALDQRFPNFSAPEGLIKFMAHCVKGRKKIKYAI